MTLEKLPIGAGNWDHLMQLLAVAHNTDGSISGLELATTNGFVGDNSTLNDTAASTWLAAVAAGTKSPVLFFPPGIYKFSGTVDFAVANCDFVRWIGLGGGPLYNQTYTGYGAKTVVFNCAKSSAGTFLSWVNSSTLQSGITLEHITLVNTGNAANVGIEIDQLNNWELHRVGWTSGWGTALLSRSNDDNAHGYVYRPLVDVAASKIGFDIQGKTGSAGGSGAGFTICGGSISGTTGSIGIRGGEFAAAMTLTDQVKFDGLTGGAIVWAGNKIESYGTHIERCSDATHAAVQLKTGSVSASGNENQWFGGVIVGTNTGGEVPFSAEAGAEGNLIVGTIFENFSGGDPYLGTVIAGKFGSYYGLNEAQIVSYASGKLGFYGTTPIVKQTGVAVSAAGIHAALVNLGLFSA